MERLSHFSNGNPDTRTRKALLANELFSAKEKTDLASPSEEQMTIIPDIMELAGVNALSWSLVVFTTEWGEYVLQPANIVSLTVATCTVVFTIARTVQAVQSIRNNRRKP